MINRDLYSKAELLRKRGNSYSQINKSLGISKSTLSTWFSNKKWSQSIKLQLINKWNKSNTNRLIRINKSRKLETVKRHLRYQNEALEKFKDLKDKPLFYTALSLYWAEGDKTQQGRVAVINSDPGLLKIIARFYREILQVPEEKIRIALFIYKDNNIEESKKYWARNLRVPKEQFIKTQILPSRSKITKRKLKYGICNVYFSSTEMNIKIKQWIKMLSREMRD